MGVSLYGGCSKQPLKEFYKLFSSIAHFEREQLHLSLPFSCEALQQPLLVPGGSSTKNKTKHLKIND